jgi:hypothetical protein
MEKNGMIVVIASLIILSALSFGVTMTTPSVGGANVSSVLAKLNVSNTPPILYEVIIVSAVNDKIDLTPGDNTTIICNASVWDRNGYQDIRSINATLFRWSVGAGAADDRNNHYTNGTCNVSNCVMKDVSTNGTCPCSFSVDYFADNATWTCNVTIMDDANFTSWNLTNFTMQPLIALNAPSEIDYGNVIATKRSSVKAINLTNLGNVQINLSVYGYGGENASDVSAENLSMICEYNNISIENHKYSIFYDNISGDSFGNGTNLTNTNQTINMSLFQRTNDFALENGNDTNATYWRIQVPTYVAGVCNGTIVFTASLG